MTSISENVASCLGGFQTLLSTLEAEAVTTLPDYDPSDISMPMVKDQLGRFKVWSANIGAHRTGRSSLDYRLRDASNIRNQVVKLLQDLSECLDDAKDLLLGETKPWNKEAWLAEWEGSDSDNSSDDLYSEPLSSMPSEMSQIFAGIVEDTNCLLRLSVSIRNPTPHDCFRQSASTHATHFEPFDIQHVRTKLPTASLDVVERLGRAISRRRQFFKYREMHQHKMASGLDNTLDTDATVQSTVASSIPDHLKAVSNIDTSALPMREDDDTSSAAWSETSYATSTTNAERRRLPALPKEADSGPFQCPICFMMVSITPRHSWKKHVFMDLRPYICVSLDCPAPDQDFQRRRQWANHTYAHHWKKWACCFGCQGSFPSAFVIKDHLATAHPETISRSNLDDLLRLCEEPKPSDDSAECPLCNESLPTFKHFQRHVGRHQEDLALFALPQLPNEETDATDDEDSEESKEEEDEEDKDGNDGYVYDGNDDYVYGARDYGGYSDEDDDYDEGEEDDDDVESDYDGE
ncbi:hypothetical protein NM208_g6520 [Fusarium decemcellulare]|uniref:Uncharacterized protein n=1 Tax=Fusarium decemcellulare TaxID=57161 RepID=A0ACC1SCT5_9HYPO|nr:hypothetical protein NM208_g6520 [Fusarium decemcellulare]